MPHGTYDKDKFHPLFSVVGFSFYCAPGVSSFQESERSCICVLLQHSTIFLLDFGIVPIVWYFVFVFYFMTAYDLQTFHEPLPTVVCSACRFIVTFVIFNEVWLIFSTSRISLTFGYSRNSSCVINLISTFLMMTHLLLIMNDLKLYFFMLISLLMTILWQF